MKRAEQLRRWEESDTNQQPTTPRPERVSRIKFSTGCIFLAACLAGDRDEVLHMLEKGADINTANVDGLTALHQVRLLYYTFCIPIQSNLCFLLYAYLFIKLCKIYVQKKTCKVFRIDTYANEVFSIVWYKIYAVKFNSLLLTVDLIPFPYM